MAGDEEGQGRAFWFCSPPRGAPAALLISPSGVTARDSLLLLNHIKTGWEVRVGVGTDGGEGRLFRSLAVASCPLGWRSHSWPVAGAEAAGWALRTSIQSVPLPLQGSCRRPSPCNHFHTGGTCWAPVAQSLAGRWCSVNVVDDERRRPQCRDENARASSHQSLLNPH